MNFEWTSQWEVVKNNITKLKIFKKGRELWTMERNGPFHSQNHVNMISLIPKIL